MPHAGPNRPRSCVTTLWRHHLLLLLRPLCGELRQQTTSRNGSLVLRFISKCDISASYWLRSEGATTKEYPCGLWRRSNAASGVKSRRDVTRIYETVH